MTLKRKLLSQSITPSNLTARKNWTLDQLKQIIQVKAQLTIGFRRSPKCKQLEEKASDISQREKTDKRNYIINLNSKALRHHLSCQMQIWQSDPIAYMEQRAKYDADLQELPTTTMQMQQLTISTTSKLMNSTKLLLESKAK